MDVLMCVKLFAHGAKLWSQTEYFMGNNSKISNCLGIVLSLYFWKTACKASLLIFLRQTSFLCFLLNPHYLFTVFPPKISPSSDRLFFVAAVVRFEFSSQVSAGICCKTLYRLFFVAAVVRFEFSSQVSAGICCKTLYTVFSRVLCPIQLDMPIISALSLLEYNAFVQHWHLREASCFTRELFTFCKLEHLIQASWS